MCQSSSVCGQNIFNISTNWTQVLIILPGIYYVHPCIRQTQEEKQYTQTLTQSPTNKTKFNSREWLVRKRSQLRQARRVVCLLLAAIVREHLIDEVAKDAVRLFAYVLFRVGRQILRVVVLEDHVRRPWGVERFVGIVGV